MSKLFSASYLFINQFTQKPIYSFTVFDHENNLSQHSRNETGNHLKVHISHTLVTGVHQSSRSLYPPNRPKRKSLPHLSLL